MYCQKYKRQVKTKDCENCISTRQCIPLCFKRELIWGVQDEEEPRWAYSRKKARYRKFDNALFMNPIIEDKISNYKFVSREQQKLHNQKNAIPQKLRWEVWMSDNFTCRNCGSKRLLEIDHVVPKSKGGKTKFSNLQTLCHKCNREKGTKINGFPTSRKRIH